MQGRWARRSSGTGALPSRDPVQRFADIVENIDAILRSTAGLGRDAFLADADKYDATERRLSRNSEAAVKLGLLAERLAPGQPGAEIRGLGNWLRHDYPGIIRDRIWETVRDDLTGLRADCEQAIQELERGG